MFLKLATVLAMPMLGFVFLTVETTNATMVPYNTYLASDWSDIHAKLDGMDGVEKHPDATYIQPWGYVNWEFGGGMLDPGTKLWIVGHDDHQVVGEVDMLGPGSYDFSTFGTTYGIYGDREETPSVDEGAGYNFEPLDILAYTGGKYYLGYFSQGLLTEGYQTLPPNDKLNNIKVTSVIVPEPASITLFFICIAFAAKPRIAAICRGN